MANHPLSCCDGKMVKQGSWLEEEDEKLIKYISAHGHGCGWSSLPERAGLNRCGKSCRLRWKNYLQPNIRRGNFTPEEAAIVFQQQSILGNRWSKIARFLPGRTDNEIKNFWNTTMRRRLQHLQQQQQQPIVSTLGSQIDDHHSHVPFNSFEGPSGYEMNVSTENNQHHQGFASYGTMLNTSFASPSALLQDHVMDPVIDMIPAPFQSPAIEHQVGAQSEDDLLNNYDLPDLVENFSSPIFDPSLMYIQGWASSSSSHGQSFTNVPAIQEPHTSQVFNIPSSTSTIRWTRLNSFFSHRLQSSQNQAQNNFHNEEAFVPQLPQPSSSTSWMPNIYLPGASL